MSVELSEKMSAWLVHVRAASEQGVSVRAYASSQGLSANAMYQAKAQLTTVGAWPRVSRHLKSSGKPVEHSRFVRAKVVPASMPCRLSHVSGWRIECESLPPAEWLASVLRSVAHVAG
jgi:hypothetical protein